MNLKKTIVIAAAVLTSICAGAKQKTTSIDIVPCPKSVEIQKGSFKAGGAAFNCDPALDKASYKVITKFANQLTMVSGKTSTIASPVGLAKSAKEGTTKGFAFYKDDSLQSGAYSIDVRQKTVIVTASDRYGFLYAIQTLKQMLPVGIYSNKLDESTKWRIPCAKIDDAPRFGYRGAHLDCARHFFSIDEVKKYIDVLAMYKLNTLHWHLTDDQGWRIEIEKYPELTEIGAFRNGSQIGHDQSKSDGIRYGGYYTKEQIRNIIAYADEQGITIIPEVDLPGHMVAVLATYPQFGCGTGPYKVREAWGIAHEVLNVGKEETMLFLEDVLGEVADLFPSKYIHIGGDECPKEEWENSPECQAKIAELGLKDDESGSAEQHLQNYVTVRMQKFLESKGKKIIAWDDVLEAKLEPGVTIMSWRGLGAAEKGFETIMTPTKFCYIDYYQSKDRDNEPIAIGGYLPVEKVYSYNPTDGLTEEQAKNVLGAQVNLWTEYIPTDEQLEYMLLPRLLAISEVQWCAPENKDFDRFKASVINHEFPILDIKGYNYCKQILKTEQK